MEIGCSGSSTINMEISADEVITKLKDDGDFDKLRFKIIQKLKENEELRSNIISTVKQSVTINRAGAENLKPRELSDAIHEEIGSTVTGQISDALWGVIRSSDGINSEIRETVELVYNRLLNPKVEEASPIREPTSGGNQVSNNCSLEISAYASGEAKETPGISASNVQPANTNEGEHKEAARPITPNDEGRTEEIEDHLKKQVLSPSDNDPSVPPGFAELLTSKQQCHATDDDPDVPPGFG